MIGYFSYTGTVGAELKVARFQRASGRGGLVLLFRGQMVPPPQVRTLSRQMVWSAYHADSTPFPPAFRTTFHKNSAVSSTLHKEKLVANMDETFNCKSTYAKAQLFGTAESSVSGHTADAAGDLLPGLRTVLRYVVPLLAVCTTNSRFACKIAILLPATWPLQVFTIQVPIDIVRKRSVDSVQVGEGTSPVFITQ